MSPNLIPIVTIFLSFTFSLSTACNVADHAALVAIKNSFPANSLPTWNTSADCCNWDHRTVQCDSKTGRVVDLLLDSLGSFVAPIPTAIFDLSALRSLTLSNLPNLNGQIPPQLSNLRRTLISLTISNTNVSGPIPTFLTKLSALEVLVLASSKFVGPIPPGIGDMPKLASLYLNGNRLTGTIPANIKAGILHLNDNRLTGSIPPSFAKVDFDNVMLGNNRLTGDPSPFFGKAKSLEVIDISHNQLSFDLGRLEYPEENLQYLDLSHNKIYGSISEQVGETASVVYFDVSYNLLCGKIPLFGQPDAEEYFGHNKCLCGAPLPACK